MLNLTLNLTLNRINHAYMQWGDGKTKARKIRNTKKITEVFYLRANRLFQLHGIDNTIIVVTLQVKATRIKLEMLQKPKRKKLAFLTLTTIQNDTWSLKIV